MTRAIADWRARPRLQDFCVNEPMAIFYGAMKGSFLAGALGVIIEEWETIKEQLESFVRSLFFLFVYMFVCLMLCCLLQIPF